MGEFTMNIKQKEIVSKEIIDQLLDLYRFYNKDYALYYLIDNIEEGIVNSYKKLIDYVYEKEGSLNKLRNIRFTLTYNSFINIISFKTLIDENIEAAYTILELMDSCGNSVISLKEAKCEHISKLKQLGYSLKQIFLLYYFNTDGSINKLLEYELPDESFKQAIDIILYETTYDNSIHHKYKLDCLYDNDRKHLQINLYVDTAADSYSRIYSSVTHNEWTVNTIGKSIIYIEEWDNIYKAFKSNDILTIKSFIPHNKPSLEIHNAGNRANVVIYRGEKTDSIQYKLFIQDITAKYINLYQSLDNKQLEDIDTLMDNELIRLWLYGLNYKETYKQLNCKVNTSNLKSNLFPFYEFRWGFFLSLLHKSDYNTIVDIIGTIIDRCIKDKSIKLNVRDLVRPYIYAAIIPMFLDDKSMIVNSMDLVLNGAENILFIHISPHSDDTDRTSKQLVDNINNSVKKALSNINF